VLHYRLYLKRGSPRLTKYHNLKLSLFRLKLKFVVDPRHLLSLHFDKLAKILSRVRLSKLRSGKLFDFSHILNLDIFVGIRNRIGWIASHLNQLLVTKFWLSARTTNSERKKDVRSILYEIIIITLDFIFFDFRGLCSVPNIILL
jgi:hypothetical protein